LLIEKYKNEIEDILAKYPPERKRSAVLPMLYLAQAEYGYCTPEATAEVAALLELDPAEVHSIVGFYTLFYDRAVGKHVVQICNDLPCALRGADQFVKDVCRYYKLDEAKVTHGGQLSADGELFFETVMCIAACDRAPCAQIDLEYAENLTPEKLAEMLSAVGEAKQ
jgi:NADH-quinone oxidoreductase subunit E